MKKIFVKPVTQLVKMDDQLLANGNSVAVKGLDGMQSSNGQGTQEANVTVGQAKRAASASMPHLDF